VISKHKKTNRENTIATYIYQVYQNLS